MSDRKIDLVVIGLLSHEDLTVTFGIDTYEAYLKWCTKAKKLLGVNLICVCVLGIAIGSFFDVDISRAITAST